MEHDTTSDETTEEMNAGCGGGGGTSPYPGGPYLPNCLVASFDSLQRFL
ncbi:hypothetical protein [Halorussus salinus]|nr:hypothetical protein [Halorussus salinus]